MRTRIFLVVALAVLGITPAVVSAQPPATPPDWTVTLAGKVWVASGWSNWSFKDAGIDPLTERRWRGVDAVVGEVGADVTWKRLIWRISVGGTGVDQGTLLQDDFAKTDHQNRFSATHSRVDGDYIFYVNNDIGARVLEWRQPLFGGAPAPGTGGYVDAFVGYQYWQEQYAAFGVQGSLIFPSGFVVNQAEPSSLKTVTNTYTRHSLRLGTRAEVPLIGGLSLKALAVISPWTHTDYEDTQYLVTGLKQPTLSSASGGFGYQLEAGLSYVVWGGLSAEAGFRYWYFDSGSGDVTTKSTNGIVVTDKLNEAITQRYGPYVGLQWRF